MDRRAHGVATPTETAPSPRVLDDKRVHLILNVAVGDKLGGEVSTEDLPATLDTDWIRVYPRDCSPTCFTYPFTEAALDE